MLPNLEGIAYGRSRADTRSDQIDYLLELVEETKDVPGAIIEVGSWKCGCSIAMAAANPNRYVYAFDLFGGLPYGNGQGFENFGDVSYHEIRVATTPYTNMRLVRGYHEQTIPIFAEKKIPVSLLFLDSDHYSSHRVTLEIFGPLVSTCGVIAFHDWTFPAVQQAIKELVDPAKFAFDSKDVQGMRVIRAL